MLEFITHYWLEVLFGGVAAALSAVLRRLWAKNKAEAAERALLRDAVLALLHDQLYTLARYHIRQQYLTIQDLNNLEHLYEVYHRMGGNGTGTELFERCKALPIKPLPVYPITEQEDS